MEDKHPLTEIHNTLSGDSTTAVEYSQKSSGSDVTMQVDQGKQQFSANNKSMDPLEQKLGVIEEQLYQYLFANLNSNELSSVNKYFLVPIGLPGMGKSTLCRFLNATSQSYFNERFNR